MISIKMIKRTAGKGMIQKFEKNPENMIAYYDLND